MIDHESLKMDAAQNSTMDQSHWLTEPVSKEIDALVVLDSQSSQFGRKPLPLRKFLGRSSTQRILYQLARKGVRCCAVFDIDGSRDTAFTLKSQAEELSIEHMGVYYVNAKSLEGVVLTWSSQVIVVQADLVFDERLMDKLIEHGAPARMTVWSEQPIGLARLNSEDVKLLRFDQDLGVQLESLVHLSELSIGNITQYVPSMRRSFPPYWQVLDREPDLDKAASKVMDSVQKGVLDFPARYLHPIPENFLAKLVAKTAITPNQVTIFSAVLAFVGTYWFATQAYLPALLIAVVAGILDGVDGKLARIKLLSSPFGDRLDHTLDVTFEFSWYIAIGWGLYQSTGDWSLFVDGFVLIGIMLVARALSGIYLLQTGRQIHDHTKFDRVVRLFAGRRNMFVFVLLFGYLTDNFLSSFYVIIFWAVFTVVIYALRNIVVFARKLLPA